MTRPNARITTRMLLTALVLGLVAAPLAQFAAATTSGGPAFPESETTPECRDAIETLRAELDSIEVLTFVIAFERTVAIAGEPCDLVMEPAEPTPTVDADINWIIDLLTWRTKSCSGEGVGEIWGTLVLLGIPITFTSDDAAGDFNKNGDGVSSIAAAGEFYAMTATPAEGSITILGVTIPTLYADADTGCGQGWEEKCYWGGAFCMPMPVTIACSSSGSAWIGTSDVYFDVSSSLTTEVECEPFDKVALNLPILEDGAEA